MGSSLIATPKKHFLARKHIISSELVHRYGLGGNPNISKKRKKCSAVVEMGDGSATVDMGRKVGGCCVPFLGHRRRSEAEATAWHKH